MTRSPRTNFRSKSSNGLGNSLLPVNFGRSPNTRAFSVRLLMAAVYLRTCIRSLELKMHTRVSVSINMDLDNQKVNINNIKSC